jgi:hypothetical protein
VVEKRILEAVAFAKGERATWFDLSRPSLPEGARERAAALAAEVDRSPYGNGLGRPLADLVLTGMATDLAHLKPKKLAHDLKLPQRAAVEACLAATRAGLLTMKWDLLCTNCRGAKLTATALSELPRGAHCPSCNIDYDRDFEKNVELSFAPAPAVRPLMAGGFCLSGPMATPHVLVQLCWRRARSAAWHSTCRPAPTACVRCIPAPSPTSSIAADRSPACASPRPASRRCRRGCR